MIKRGGIVLLILLMIIYFYAVLNLFIGILQIFKQMIPIRNTLLFILGSISILVTLFLIKTPPLFLIFLIVGFIFIQIGAIFNGIYLHGKMTISHQLIRFSLLIIITIFYLEFI